MTTLKLALFNLISGPLISKIIQPVKSKMASWTHLDHLMEVKYTKKTAML